MKPPRRQSWPPEHFRYPPTGIPTIAESEERKRVAEGLRRKEAGTWGPLGKLCGFGIVVVLVSAWVAETYFGLPAGPWLTRALLALGGLGLLFAAIQQGFLE
jgi:hypothetical protein